VILFILEVTEVVLRTKVKFASTIDPESARQLKKLAELTRIPQSRLIDEAIKDLIAKYKVAGYNDL
jgi:hypothetical protein